MSKQIKILIADDNAITVGMLNGLLKKDNTLATALTGAECIEIIPDFSPDIILLDLMLPDIDGYEICKTIRARHQDPRPIIIIISAKSKIEDKQLAYQLGADDYIEKPFSNDELTAKIRAYSRLKRIEHQERTFSRAISSLSDQTRILNTTIETLTNSLGELSGLSEYEQLNLRSIQIAGKELLKLMEAS